MQLPPLYLLLLWTDVQLSKFLNWRKKNVLVLKHQLNTLKGILMSDLNAKHRTARNTGVIFRIMLHLEPVLEQLGVNLPCSGDTMTDEVQEI